TFEEAEPGVRNQNSEFPSWQVIGSSFWGEIVCALPDTSDWRILVLALDCNGNGSHSARHDRFDLGGKPGKVRISQARQEGAKGQQRFLGNQVEVVSLEVEQAPQVRGLASGVLRRVILMAEVRRDRSRLASQR